MSLFKLLVKSTLNTNWRYCLLTDQLSQRWERIACIIIPLLSKGKENYLVQYLQLVDTIWLEIGPITSGTQSCTTELSRLSVYYVYLEHVGFTGINHMVRFRRWWFQAWGRHIWWYIRCWVDGHKGCRKKNYPQCSQTSDQHREHQRSTGTSHLPQVSLWCGFNNDLFKLTFVTV